MKTETKKENHILDRLRPRMDEVYPENGRKPDPVKAAKVRKELMTDLDWRKMPSGEFAAVGVLLDAIVKRAVFDAVAGDARARERAYEYFSTVRKSGTWMEKRLAVDYLCEKVKLPKNADLAVLAMEQAMESGKAKKLGEVKVLDGTGRVEMIEIGDLIEQSARMLMTLQDPKAVDVLFETGRKLGDHPMYVKLGKKLTETAEKIQEESRKKKVEEFRKYAATEPPGTFLDG